MLNIIYHDELESTNTHLKSNIHNHKHGDCIVAIKQTAGRGQLGTKWVSTSDKNLTCSFLVDWSKVKVNNQFQISKLVAIVLLSEIKALLPDEDVKIKWPNDIFVGNEKVAGILIENTIQHDLVEKSIIGIGVNVNQEEFPDFGNKKATSLTNKIGKRVNIFALVKKIGDTLLEEIANGRVHDSRSLDRIYLNYLLGYKTQQLFQDNYGEFKAEIKSIDPNGKLVVKTLENESKTYDLKEIQMVL